GRVRAVGAGPQRPAIRAAAVPDQQRPHAGVRRDGGDQPRPRQPLHDRGLRGLRHHPTHGGALARLAGGGRGRLAFRRAARTGSVPTVLPTGTPRPSAAHLRADPAVRGGSLRTARQRLPQRAGAGGAGLLRPCDRCLLLLRLPSGGAGGLPPRGRAHVPRDRAYTAGQRRKGRGGEAGDGGAARPRRPAHPHGGLRGGHGAGDAGRGAGRAAAVRLPEHGRRVPHRLLRGGRGGRRGLGRRRLLGRAADRVGGHVGQGLRAGGGGARGLRADGGRAALAAGRPFRAGGV
ncbi:MAG: High-affinity branched-chain amino acid transport system permease protein LivH, partial [uncultured Acetobacteraceae bacterium]